MTDTNSKAQVTDAHRHAVALRQCALFAADVGEHIVKAMVDAADFLDGPALAAQEKPEPGVAVKAAKPFMYGIMEPDGTAYMDEACVDLSGDTLKELIEEDEMAGYTVVPLYLHPAPSPDLPEGEVEPTETEKLRSALRAAVDTIQDYLAYQHDGDPWSEDSRTMGEMDINDYARDGRLDYALALLPSPSPIDKGEVK